MPDFTGIPSCRGATPDDLRRARYCAASLIPHNVRKTLSDCKCVRQHGFGGFPSCSLATCAYRQPMIGNRSIGSVARSEEHTSELQSLMRISYAVLCLKKTNKNIYKTNIIQA